MVSVMRIRRRFRLQHILAACFTISFACTILDFNQVIVSFLLRDAAERIQMKSYADADQPSSLVIHNTSKTSSSMKRRIVSNRRTCCLSSDRMEDICGQTNCTSPLCSSPEVLNQVLKSDGQNAFFIETSGSGALNIRQACAVESLAFHNSNLSVTVLFMDDDAADGDMMKFNVRSSSSKQSAGNIIEKLKDKYSNIQFIIANLNEYMAGTSMEKWYHCNDWRQGPYRISHLSDALRFLTLHKYGGYYFDLDVILLRPVTYYRNFVAAESGVHFGSSVIHADYGHPIMQLAVQDFPLNYKRDVWSHNGPDLLMRIMKSYCGEENLSAMDFVSCRGFSALPASTFSPIWWGDWQSFFSQRRAGETRAPSWITKHVVGVHIWNKLSFNETAYKNSTQEYVRIVRDNCPVIFSIAPETF